MTLSYKSMLKRQNVECQTDLSIDSSPETFDFSKDNQLIQNEEQPKFRIELKQVEKLVSAVQGEDEEIRQKFKIANHRTHRFRSALRLLNKQLDEISKTSDESEFENLKNKFIRELAYSIDPASRHGKGRKNLFDHQRYEKSLCDCQARIKNPRGSDQTFDAVYSYNEKLYLLNDNEIYYFNEVPSENLNGKNKIQLTYKDQAIGQATFTKENKQLKSISEDEKLDFLFRGLGYEDSKKIKGLINFYDFSFIDVILSLPNLTEKEAKSLMVNLYHLNFLSAYVRAKICQFIYERDQRKAWPELLGRFISLLSQSWYNESINDMLSRQFPKVINNLANMTPHATFILQIIIDEFLGMERGDLVDFIWEFFCHSVFMNNYLNKENEKSIILSFYKRMQNKSVDSKTRKETMKILNSIQATKVNIKSLKHDPSKFFNDILTNHNQDIITILQNIPFTKEEASPLFFPLALEIKEELNSYDKLRNIQSESDESNIISNVESRMYSERYSTSSRRDPRYISSSTSESSSSYKPKGRRKNDDSQLSESSSSHHRSHRNHSKHSTNHDNDFPYQRSSSQHKHLSSDYQSSSQQYENAESDQNNFEEENLFEEEEAEFEEEEAEFEEEDTEFIEEEEYDDSYQ